jgi:glycosyltransferase involved in cell wall biosynthesis
LSRSAELPRLLLVGHFLSATPGSRSVIEDLADRLRPASPGLVCVSPYRSGWARGAHLLAVALRRRSEFDVAVVDVYSGRAFRWAELAAALLRRRRCPFVFVLRGGGLAGFAGRHPSRARRCLQKAAAVAAPSRFLLERLRPYRDDLLLLPNPLDLPRYPFRRRSPALPTLVWLRALQAMYNPTMGPQVVARLRPDFPRIHLTMIGPDKGDGSGRRIHDTARGLGVLDHVSLPGGVTKAAVPAWLNQGDVFLNTTDVDNAPVSVLEAMACGLCVVSTDAGGLPHLLQDGRDALLVPRGDAAAMAEAVRRVLTDPTLAARLSENARRAVEPHDWGAVLPRWEALLCSVAGT